MNRKSIRYSVAPSQSQSQTIRNTDRFPILPDEEIIDTLEKYHIMIDSRTLSKPNEQIVRSVFTSFLHLSDLVSDLSSLSKNCEGSEYRLSYLEFTVLLMQLQKLFRACKINDFNMMDIIKPNAHDFKRQLCAWINFKRFVNNRMDELRPVLDKNKELHLKAQEYSAKVDKMREESEILFNGPKSLANLIQKRDKSQKMLQINLSKLKEKEDELQRTEASKEELKVSIESLSNEIDEIESISQSLTRQIVPSPDRLKKDKKQIETEISTRNQELQQNKRRIIEEENIYKSYKEELINQNNIKEELEDYVKKMYEVEDLNKILNELRNKELILQAKAKEAANTKQVQQERYDLMMKHWKSELQHARTETEKLEKRKKENETKKEKMKKHIELLNRSLSENKEQHASCLNRKEAIAALVEDKENLYFRNSAVIVNTLAEAYQTLTDNIQSNSLK